MSILLALLLAGLSDGAPQSAPSAALVETGAAAAPAKPKKAHKICRETSRSGSNIIKTTCLTKAEWDGQTASDQTGSDTSGAIDVPGNRVATGAAINTGTPGTGPGR